MDANQKEMFMKKLKVFWAEFAGSFALLLFGCSGGLSIYMKDEDRWRPGTSEVTMSWGLTVAFINTAIAHISFAHINPAITITAFILKRIQLIDVLVYFLAEFLGSICGFAMLKYLLPTHIRDKACGLEKDLPCYFCVTIPIEDDLRSIIWEFLATGYLIWVVCSLWDPKNNYSTLSAGVIFFFTVTILTTTVGSYTGCSMNPTRSIAPALINWNFNHLWIYVISPPAASVVFTYMYKYLYLDNGTVNTLALPSFLTHGKKSEAESKDPGADQKLICLTGQPESFDAHPSLEDTHTV